MARKDSNLPIHVTEWDTRLLNPQLCVIIKSYIKIRGIQLARFQSSKFTKTTEVIDGNEYIDCAFKNCHIILSRGNFRLDRCTFDSCRFEFAGEAQNIRSVVMMLLTQKPSESLQQNE